MRRFAPAAVVALLAIAVASPVNAGYLIIRVILDGGGGGGAGGGEGGAMTGYGGRPMQGSQMPPGGVGRPGAGGPSFGGPGEGAGMPGAGGQAGTHDPSRSLVVVVPIEEDLNVPSTFYRGTHHPLTNPTWKPKLHLAHRGQKFVTNLFSDSASIQWYEPLLQVPSPRKTRASEIKDQHYAWTKSAKTDPKPLFTVLTRALEAGMVDDAVAYADELLAFAAGKPEGLPPEVANFVKAYKAMQKGIKGPPARPGPAEEWKIRLDAANVHTQGHYALISWDAGSGEVQRRATALEENFKGFYLWHATRGVELPVPDAPLVAVLAKSGGTVFNLARAIDGPNRLSADGFYAPDHDLLVLSPERLDEVGQTFVRQAQQMYSAGASRNDLLEGKGPKIHKNAENGAKQPEQVARMQTLALVDRLVEDQSFVSTISREGSRQLLYATRQLPRYVQLPEWLNHGATNFFTRPKDPAFITNDEGKTSIAVALTTGYGGPNYVLQRYFKDLLDKKELNPDRGALLKSVLTDAYFKGLRDPQDVSDPDPTKAAGGLALGGSTTAGGTTGGVASGGGMRPMGYPMGYGSGGQGRRPGGGGSLDEREGAAPGPGVGGVVIGATGPPQDDPATLLRKKRDRLGIKAQATSWALYYYLAKDRPEELRRFLDELSALPRDLPLDGDTVTAAFCRAFKLDGSKESLTRFADAWLDAIRSVPPAAVVPDIPLTEPKASATAGSGSGRPGLGGGNPDGERPPN